MDEEPKENPLHEDDADTANAADEQLRRQTHTDPVAESAADSFLHRLLGRVKIRGESPSESLPIVRSTSERGDLTTAWQAVVETDMTDHFSRFRELFEKVPPGERVNFPFTMVPLDLDKYGAESKGAEDLSPQELAFVKQQFFKTIGFNPDNAQLAGEYDVKYENSRRIMLHGRIYETDHSNEGLYLHEQQFLGGKPRPTIYLAAAKGYR